MNKIIAVLAVIVAFFAIAGTTSAARVAESFPQTSQFWGYVNGEMETWVYKLKDPENGTTCYFAYYGKNKVPDMECIK